MPKTDKDAGNRQVNMVLPVHLATGWKALAQERGMTMTTFQVLVMNQVLESVDSAVGLHERSAMAKKRSLTLSLRLDEIALIREAARVEGHSLAGWVAMAVRSKLKEAMGADVALSAQRERSEKATKQALSLRLRLDEIAAVREAAAVDGYSLSGWVAMLVRARLKQAPILTGDEVSGLLKAAGQLMAVGRNINAAVRKLHTEGKWTQQNQPMLAAMAAVDEMKVMVKALLAAAERRGTF